MCAVLIGLVTPIRLDLLLIKNVDAMIVALSSKERRYGCRQRRYNRGREWMDWSSPEARMGNSQVNHNLKHPFSYFQIANSPFSAIGTLVLASALARSKIRLQILRVEQSSRLSHHLDRAVLAQSLTPPCPPLVSSRNTFSICFAFACACAFAIMFAFWNVYDDKAPA